MGKQPILHPCPNLEPGLPTRSKGSAGFLLSFHGHSQPRILWDWKEFQVLLLRSSFHLMYFCCLVIQVCNHTEDSSCLGQIGTLSHCPCVGMWTEILVVGGITGSPLNIFWALANFLTFPTADASHTSAATLSGAKCFMSSTQAPAAYTTG